MSERKEELSREEDEVDRCDEEDSWLDEEIEEEEFGSLHPFIKSSCVASSTDEVLVYKDVFYRIHFLFSIFTLASVLLC